MNFPFKTKAGGLVATDPAALTATNQFATAALAAVGLDLAKAQAAGDPNFLQTSIKKLVGDEVKKATAKLVAERDTIRGQLNAVGGALQDAGISVAGLKSADELTAAISSKIKSDANTQASADLFMLGAETGIDTEETVPDGSQQSGDGGGVKLADTIATWGAQIGTLDIGLDTRGVK